MLTARHRPAQTILPGAVAAFIIVATVSLADCAQTAAWSGVFPASPFPFNSVMHEAEMGFADDGTFVFCSAKTETAVAHGDELDIYLAKYDEATGTFSDPVNMGLGINSAPDSSEVLRNGLDIEPFISADGNRLYFRSNRLADSAECARRTGKHCQPDTHWSGGESTKLFLSTKLANGTWGVPAVLPYPINTESGSEHCPVELRDGKTLCVTTSRPGGYGGSDIWCAAINGDGTYGEPYNMGPNINTAAHETHFAVHPIDGHVSFVSTRDEDWGDLYISKPDGVGGWLPATKMKISQPDRWEACPAFTPNGKIMLYFSTSPLVSGSLPETCDIQVIPNPVD